MQCTSEDEIFIRRQLRKAVCARQNTFTLEPFRKRGYNGEPAKLRWYTSPPALLITCDYTNGVYYYVSMFSVLEPGVFAPTQRPKTTIIYLEQMPNGAWFPIRSEFV